MGTGTCAVLWKTMRNVVSTQALNGKGRRGDNCHLKALIQGQGLQRGVRLTLMEWQDDYAPTCPNTTSSTRMCLPQVEGKRGDRRSFEGTKVSHGEIIQS